MLPVGESFANTLSDYDSISPGRWFDPDGLSPYRLTLTKFVAKYDTSSQSALGDPLDYTAYVRTQVPGEKPKNQTIKVNSPLRLGDTDIYLLSNGYAPVVTVRNPAGKVVFAGPVPFLPIDTDLTSQGVIKVPDGLAKQIGMIGFFYPTECDTSATTGTCGAAPVSVEIAIKATYLYKIPPFIEWPAEVFASGASPFTICVVGADPFGALLDQAVAGQRLGERAIVLRRMGVVQPMSGCQVLFVSGSAEQSVQQALDTVRGELSRQRRPGEIALRKPRSASNRAAAKMSVVLPAPRNPPTIIRCGRFMR